MRTDSIAGLAAALLLMAPAALTLAVTPAAAQEQAATPKPTPAAPPIPGAAASPPSTTVTPVSRPLTCDLAEHRQFDFWIGDWDVFQPDGTQVGTNRITLILGTCVLLETWTGKSGLEGWSFNVYDRAERKWHQTWVDDRGTRLDLVGTLVGKSMVLTGTRPDPAGATITDRITWTPIDANRVRQLWEQSKDGGRTWTTTFEGNYVRQAGGAAGTPGRDRRR